jgi:Protein of unknown function (DUF2612)
MKDLMSTVLAQYANSPKLMAILDYMNQWVDPSTNLDDFYDTFWNILTAQGVGLDIWGRIVDVDRNLQIVELGNYFGFSESLAGGSSTPQPFGQAVFWNGPPASTTYALADDAYRKLILVKALANITDCTAPNLNKLLGFLFEGRGRCYVVDLGGMRIRYVFEFTLTPVELSIMVNSTAVPRPAGVLTQIMTVDPATTFGFQEAGGQPFGQGVFFTQSEIQDAQ